MFSRVWSAGSSVARQNPGQPALRVGWLIASRPCCTANMISTSHTEPTPLAGHHPQRQ